MIDWRFIGAKNGVQMTKMLLANERQKICVVRPWLRNELGVDEQEKGAYPDVGAQEAVEDIACPMVMAVAKRYPANQGLVYQDGNIIPEWRLAHVETLHVGGRVGDVEEPLRQAQKEVGVKIAIDYGMLAERAKSPADRADGSHILSWICWASSRTTVT